MNCFELVRILKFRIAAVVADTANITFEQAEMMRTLFRTMTRLTDDEEVKALCRVRRITSRLPGERH
jgi:ribosomal protein S3AE